MAKHAFALAPGWKYHRHGERPPVQPLTPELLDALDRFGASIGASPQRRAIILKQLKEGKRWNA